MVEVINHPILFLSPCSAEQRLGSWRVLSSWGQSDNRWNFSCWDRKREEEKEVKDLKKRTLELHIKVSIHSSEMDGTSRYSASDRKIRKLIYGCFLSSEDHCHPPICQWATYRSSRKTGLGSKPISKDCFCANALTLAHGKCQVDRRGWLPRLLWKDILGYCKGRMPWLWPSSCTVYLLFQGLRILAVLIPVVLPPSNPCLPPW